MLFGEAYHYLNQADAAGELDKMMASENIFLLTNPNLPNQDCYKPGTENLCWDPFSALYITSDKILSPALGLVHEAAHANNHDINPNQWIKDVKEYDPLFDNKEEKKSDIRCRNRCSQN